MAPRVSSVQTVEQLNVSQNHETPETSSPARHAANDSMAYSYQGITQDLRGGPVQQSLGVVEDDEDLYGLSPQHDKRKAGKEPSAQGSKQTSLSHQQDGRDPETAADGLKAHAAESTQKKPGKPAPADKFSRGVPQAIDAGATRKLKLPARGIDSQAFIRPVSASASLTDVQQRPHDHSEDVVRPGSKQSSDSQHRSKLPINEDASGKGVTASSSKRVTNISAVAALKAKRQGLDGSQLSSVSNTSKAAVTKQEPASRKPPQQAYTTTLAAAKSQTSNPPPRSTAKGKGKGKIAIRDDDSWAPARNGAALAPQPGLASNASPRPVTDKLPSRRSKRLGGTASDAQDCNVDKSVGELPHAKEDASGPPPLERNTKKASTLRKRRSDEAPSSGSDVVGPKRGKKTMVKAAEPLDAPTPSVNPPKPASNGPAQQDDGCEVPASSPTRVPSQTGNAEATDSQSGVTVVKDSLEMLSRAPGETVIQEPNTAMAEVVNLEGAAQENHASRLPNPDLELTTEHEHLNDLPRPGPSEPLAETANAALSYHHQAESADEVQEEQPSQQLIQDIELSAEREQLGTALRHGSSGSLAGTAHAALQYQHVEADRHAGGKVGAPAQPEPNAPTEPEDKEDAYSPNVIVGASQERPVIISDDAEPLSSPARSTPSQHDQHLGQADAPQDTDHDPPKTPAMIPSSPPFMSGATGDRARKPTMISFDKSGPRNQGSTYGRTPGRGSAWKSRSSLPPIKIPLAAEAPSSKARLDAKRRKGPSSVATSVHTTRSVYQAPPSNVASDVGDALAGLLKRPVSVKATRKAQNLRSSTSKTVHATTTGDREVARSSKAKGKLSVGKELDSSPVDGQDEVADAGERNELFGSDQVPAPEPAEDAGFVNFEDFDGDTLVNPGPSSPVLQASGKVTLRTQSQVAMPPPPTKSLRLRMSEHLAVSARPSPAVPEVTIMETRSKRSATPEPSTERATKRQKAESAPARQSRAPIKPHDTDNTGLATDTPARAEAAIERATKRRRADVVLDRLSKASTESVTNEQPTLAVLHPAVHSSSTTQTSKSRSAGTATNSKASAPSKSLVVEVDTNQDSQRSALPGTFTGHGVKGVELSASAGKQAAIQSGAKTLVSGVLSIVPDAGSFLDVSRDPSVAETTKETTEPPAMADQPTVLSSSVIIEPSSSRKRKAMALSADVLMPELRHAGLVVERRKRFIIQPSHQMSQGSQTVDNTGSPVPRAMDLPKNSTVLDYFATQTNVSSDPDPTQHMKGDHRKAPKDRERTTSTNDPYAIPPSHQPQVLESNRKQRPAHPQAASRVLSGLTLDSHDSKRLLSNDNSISSMHDPFTSSEDLAKSTQSRFFTDLVRKVQEVDVPRKTISFTAGTHEGKENFIPTGVKAPKPARHYVPAASKGSPTPTSSSDSSGSSTSLRDLTTWRNALQPHQLNIFDELVNISHRLTQHLVDEETAAQHAVQDYHQRSLRMIEQMELDHARRYQQYELSVHQRRKAMKKGLKTHREILAECVKIVQAGEEEHAKRMEGRREAGRELEALIARLS